MSTDNIAVTLVTLLVFGLISTLPAQEVGSEKEGLGQTPEKSGNEKPGDSATDGQSPPPTRRGRRRGRARVEPPEVLKNVNLQSEAGFEEYLKAAQSDDKEVRIYALRALSQVSSKARRALPAALESLSNTDRDVRLASLFFLSSMANHVSSEDQALVPALLETLTQGAEETRDVASLLLEKMAPHAEKTRQKLIALLENGVFSQNYRALVALGPLTSRDEDVVPGLVKLVEKIVHSATSNFPLSHPPYETVTRAIGELGAEAKPAVEALVKALDKKDDRLSDMAVRSLGFIGPEAAEAVPHLIKVLESEPKAQRIAAIRALGSIGPRATAAIPALIEVLRFGDSLYRDYRFWASQALAQIGSPSVPHLQKALENEDPTIRQGVGEALAIIGPKAKDAVAALRTRLSDEKMLVRIQIANALWEVDRQAEPSLKVLTQAFETDNRQARRLALRSLAHLEADAKPAVPRLLEILETADPRERSEVLLVLSAIGPGAKAAIPVLVKQLNEGKARAPATVCSALGKIGPQTEAVLPTLRNVYTNAGPRLKSAAAYAFSQIGPQVKEALPAFIRELERWASVPGAMQEREGVSVNYAELMKLYTLETVANLGPQARDALPSLKAFFDRAPLDLKIKAAGAIWRVSGESKDLLPVLLTGLRDKNLNERDALGRPFSGIAESAIYTAADIGAKAKDLAPDLYKLIKMTSHPLSRTAALALWNIGEHQDMAKNLLLKDLKSFNQRLRREAIVRLGKIKQKPELFLPTLQEALQDIGTDIRKAARGALKEIRKS